jgi:hypothetical protein
LKKYNIKPFMGNPCGYGNCLDGNCDRCKHWSPCIYVGKTFKRIKLPKWKWLVNMLYKIEMKLLWSDTYGKF